ncbi:DUF6612 family protein [Bacillus sp. FJAT-44742]|uniref:DUF6612 family protein n=1 Tax=Bacillus sp. FJAT-44742 TaxID=2014005 RepID=UPI000C2410FF|nr:DUF6612 family protein [Bacillus sp. FJAT-44742]
MAKKFLVTGTSLTLAAVLTFAPSAAGASSASDVLKQSGEAMKDINSFSTTIDIHQTMNDPLGEQTEISSYIEQDIIIEPFALWQKETTLIEELGEEITLESYWTEEGMYQEEPDGSWVRLPADDFGDLQDLHQSPDQQLAEAEALGEEMVLHEENDHYLLTYEGDGEELWDIAQQTMNGNGQMGSEEEMELLDEMMDEMMEEVSFNDFTFDLKIDKDTYYLTEMSMDVDMDIALGLEEGTEDVINIQMSMVMSLHNFNGVDAVVVPDEVKESAVEFDELLDEQLEEHGEEEGGSLPDTATTNPFFLFTGIALSAVAGLILLARRTREVKV